jgi:hypothetical protein
LQSLDPSPQPVRQLTRQLLAEIFEDERSTSVSDSSHRFLPDRWRPPSPWKNVLQTLFANCGSYHSTIVDEIDSVLAALEGSGDENDCIRSARFVASVTDAGELIQRHASTIIIAAEVDTYVRCAALRHGLITMNRALEMPGEMGTLLQNTVDFFGLPVLPPYLENVFQALTRGWPAFAEPAIVADLATIGEYLLHHQEPPWLIGEVGEWNDVVTPADRMESAALRGQLSPGASLAAAVLLAILTERATFPDRYIPSSLGPLHWLGPYLIRRRQVSRGWLPDCPLPKNFERIFRKWAMRHADFSSY